MDEVAQIRPRRGASPEQIALLLARLDPDRDQAGEKYEDLRRKLVKFFECNGCYPAEDLADETLDRTAKRLDDVKDVVRFAFGVARKVRLEAYEAAPRTQQSADDPTGEGNPAAGVEFSEAAMIKKIDQEKRLTCLGRCMKRLSDEERDQVIEYHTPEEEPPAQRRQRMAKSLGVSSGALRAKMNRLRDKLELCVKACVGARSVGNR
jgi:DNA-directed RNA polymerase specialized sigma24 family protein